MQLLNKPSAPYKDISSVVYAVEKRDINKKGLISTFAWNFSRSVKNFKVGHKQEQGHNNTFLKARLLHLLRNYIYGLFFKINHLLFRLLLRRLLAKF